MNAVAERVVCTLLCASALAGTVRAGSSSGAEVGAPQHPRAVYYDGKTIEMSFVPGRGEFKVGPWIVSAQVLRDKPKDGHPNLYVVAPGSQYSEAGAEQYSHNEIVSVIPVKQSPLDWDVYFAIVLDPTLHEDFRSEQQLIIATQDDFEPAADFRFEDIPGAAFLTEYLSITSIEELDAFRRSDGKLPRLVIIPAKLTLKATATDPENPQQQSLKSSLHTSAKSSALPH